MASLFPKHFLGMLVHEYDPDANHSSRILDDVEKLLFADILLEVCIFIIAGLLNSSILLVEVRHWRRKGCISLPRLLVCWLAAIDAIGVFVGLFPKFIVLAIQPCPRLLFKIVHMLTLALKIFADLMSKLTVVLMGIERFTSILKPFYYLQTCTTKTLFLVEMFLVVYSVSFAGLSSFFNYYHYQDTHILYHGLEEESCHKLFLIFEFGHVNHYVDFPWNLAELCGNFQLFQLVQYLVIICILVICNLAVNRSVFVMDQRLKKVYPILQNVHEKPSTPIRPRSQGREFSRLMTTINVSVLLLTTPQMVIKIYVCF